LGYIKRRNRCLEKTTERYCVKKKYFVRVSILRKYKTEAGDIHLSSRENLITNPLNQINVFVVLVFTAEVYRGRADIL